MKGRSAGYLVSVFLILCLAGCGKSRIIPPRTLADIYADMLIQDQWLKDHPRERKSADTMLFYEPIFAKYGYTFKDYDASVSKYLEDPERFSKILARSSRKLKSKADYYRKLRESYEEILNGNALAVPYLQKDMDADTLLWQPLYELVCLDTVKVEYAWSDTLKAREDREKRNKKKLDNVKGGNRIRPNKK